MFVYRKMKKKLNIVLNSGLGHDRNHFRARPETCLQSIFFGQTKSLAKKYPWFAWELVRTYPAK